MISYKKAREIADSYNDRTDYVTEYDDAYVFSIRGLRCIGGEGEPIAVMKEDGSVTTYTAYLDDGGRRQIGTYDKR